MTREPQKEFFEEFKEEKGKIKKIAEKVAWGRKRHSVNVPAENIVFLVIILMMSVVIAFALGVERGKRLISVVPEAQIVEYKEESKEPDPVAGRVSLETKPEAEPGAAEKTIMKENEPPYTIQLIAYKQKAAAEKEKNKLLNKQREAFIIPSGDWYQVCAGNYASVKDAESRLKEFSKDYKGCFVRKK